MKSALRLALLSGIAALFTDCPSVQPWQRGRLAEYGMRPDRDPLTDGLMEHVFFSRETAHSGRNIGGGCGCN